MIREPLSPAGSIIGRIDPRFRIGCATVFSFVTALSSDRTALWAALFMAVSLAVAARSPIRETARRLTPIFGFLLLLWVVVPLTYGGEAAYHLGPFPISREGTALCAAITLKATAIALLFTALVASLPIWVMGHALDRMGVPAKLVHLLLVTYRYTFLFEAEYQRLVRAARIRGFKPATNLHTYRTYAYILGMLFVRAADRGERVHRAMKCRGFNGRFHSLAEFARRPADLWFSAFAGLGCLAILFIEWRPLPW